MDAKFAFPNHPVYGAPLSGRHIHDGILFASYYTGVLRYARVSLDGRIELRQRMIRGRDWWTVWLDGERLAPPRKSGFRTADDAVRAARAKAESQ